MCTRIHLRDISAVVIEISKMRLRLHTISTPEREHLLLQVDGEDISRCGFCAAEIANRLSKVAFISWGPCHIS